MGFYNEQKKFFSTIHFLFILIFYSFRIVNKIVVVRKSDNYTNFHIYVIIRKNNQPHKA